MSSGKESFSEIQKTAGGRGKSRKGMAGEAYARTGSFPEGGQFSSQPYDSQLKTKKRKPTA